MKHTGKPSHILIVDDEERMRYLLSKMLEDRGYRVSQAGDGVEALEMVRQSSYHMVITDIKMPRMNGLELLEKIKPLQIPVVFITAFATVDSAVEAMRTGAVDYITKPFEEDRILVTVERTLRLSRLMTENVELKQKLRKAEEPGEVIYVSDIMAGVMDSASRVAKSDSGVFITGESGTGKELLARYIHDQSARGPNRFVPVNCAAISPSLVESELFGHEKGSFTGADRRVEGKFEYAAQGTLLLDEIGDLPLEAQAKLLRALQEKKIQRVGGNEEIPVDVRVICATNKKLNRLVEAGQFRKDLFFRINVFPIHLPTLAERTEDIVPLAEYFLKKLDMIVPSPRLDETAVKCLLKYPWPGNVRELANALERAAIHSGDTGIITGKTLSFLTGSAIPRGDHEGFELPVGGIHLEELENDLIRQACERAGNNQTEAARLLGVTRGKFRTMMKQSKKQG
ncbi:MAG: sigma-54-dependent Fis family transcriptional regulator [Deltaproteobacteria bacterium]|nr:sigma-54-dependent Fis family transcriptional regulator [Deltaproteobacteria bacterium]